MNRIGAGPQATFPGESLPQRKSASYWLVATAEVLGALMLLTAILLQFVANVPPSDLTEQTRNIGSVSDGAPSLRSDLSEIRTHLRDFGTFYHAGAAARQDENPYGIGALSFYIESRYFDGYNPNLNPPSSLLIFAPLSMLEPGIAYQLVWWSSFVLFTAGVIALGVMRGRSVSRWLILWAFSYPGLWDTLDLGQIYALPFVFAIIGYAALQQERQTLAGAAFGLIAALKPNFLVLPVLLLLAGHTRVALPALLSFGLTSLLPALLFGPESYVQWVETLLSSDPGRVPFLTNISLMASAARLNLLWLGFVVGAALLAALALWAWRCRPTARATTNVAMIGAILASPIAWFHYVLFIYPVLFSCRWNRTMKIGAGLLIVPLVVSFSIANLIYAIRTDIGLVTQHLLDFLISSPYTWGYILIAVPILGKSDDTLNDIMKRIAGTVLWQRLRLFPSALPAILSLVAFGFLSFLLGAVVTLRGDSGMQRMLRDTASLSTLIVPQFDAGPFGHLWRPVRTPLPPDGVTITRYDPAQAFNGLTLIVTADAPAAHLVNMRGDEVHRWQLPFQAGWKTFQGDLDDNESKDSFYWRRVRLFPNGDLLAIYENPTVTPYGQGLVKLDKDSNILWRLDENLHHDVSVGANGKIYALGQEISVAPRTGLPKLYAPYISDYIAVISPDGKLEKKIPLINAFENSMHRPSLTRMYFASLLGDVTHTNTIRYITDRQAAAVPFAKAGQLLISMREMDMIAILDPEEESIAWTMSGLWFRQHEPQMLANGNMLIFDNLGHLGPEGGSRLIEFDPLTQKVAWSYAGTADDPLFTLGYGSQQRLPNGNTLIVESENGRLLEVTEDKDVVWSYRSPARRTYGETKYISVVTDAIRFSPDELPFLLLSGSGN